MVEMCELEKVDLIRERMGVSYERAREVLTRCGGDVVAALVLLEQAEDPATQWTERIQVSGQELVDKVRDLIHEGNVRRILIKKDDQVLIEFPVTVGAVGVILVPTLAALGVIAALVTRCTLEVVRRDHAATAEGEPDSG